MRVTSLAAVIAMCACGSEERAPAAPPTASAQQGAPAAPPSTAAQQGAPATRALPPGVTATLVATMCKATPCGSELSRLEVYRDATGAVKRFVRTYGGCSHSPQLYFHPDGSQSDSMAETPVVPGSDVAERFRQQHERQVGGLVAAESISCRE